MREISGTQEEVFGVDAERNSTFFNYLTSKKKKDLGNASWEKITKKSIEMGILPSHKDAKYVRDIYWQNLRKRTMKKIDQSRQTGSAGGKEVVLNEIDNMVMDIIGNTNW